MKTAIILHGMPSKNSYYDASKDAQSNAHWLPWIQQQLLVKDILAQTLELPAPYSPVYEAWKAVFEKFDVNEETILVGHSCGAGFLVRWLSENKIRTGKVVLVAPYLDPKHTLSTEFFNFEIDTNVPNRVADLSLFVSDDDEDYIQTSVDVLKIKWPEVKIFEMKNKGHFTLGDMGTREFPELRDFLLA